MFSRTARVLRNTRAHSRRQMAGHAAPPPEGGIDAIVYKYLPGNHQVAMAIIGLYGSLFLTYKIFSSFGKKKEEPKAVVAAPATGGADEIPSVDSPSFDTWVSTPGNIEKFFDTCK